MESTDPRLKNLTPFKKGVSGNPGGKTSAQRKAEVKAAEISAKLRLKMLQALDGQVAENPESAADFIKSDVLRLFKDSEDRAFGTPTSKIEGNGEAGELIHRVEHVILDSKPRE